MLKIFRKKSKLTPIELHIAGSTVQHKSPFESLKIPFVVEELSKDFIDKWIVPYYMTNFTDDNRFDDKFKKIKNEVNPSIVKDLLGFYDWRSRIVGAIFTSIMDYREFEEIIGIHLLKSEVCYAGEGYCMTLASLNTDKSIEFLKSYLDYYLIRKDLWYDQKDVMAAINWLDKINNTNNLDSFMDQWKSFVSDKPYWNLDSSIDYFNKKMTRLNEIKNGM